MPLTRRFKDTVMARLRRDADFRDAMLRGAVEELLAGEIEVAKDVLRDYVNATIGFDDLGKATDLSPKSLMRMLGRGGNPQASNLLSIIAALQEHAGVEFHVTSKPVTKKRVSNRRKTKARTTNIRYRDVANEAPRGFAEAGTKFKR